jgi:hypothetical protein
MAKMCGCTNMLRTGGLVDGPKRVAAQTYCTDCAASGQALSEPGLLKHTNLPK